MSLVWYALWFVVAVGVLVTVHEFGHFWVARRLGFKVLRFSVGFGRPLLKRIAGADRIEYVVAAVPLGGYVKLLDEREGPVAPHELSRGSGSRRARELGRAALRETARAGRRAAPPPHRAGGALSRTRVHVLDAAATAGARAGDARRAGGARGLARRGPHRGDRRH